MRISSIAIIGAGSWGTALAIHLSSSVEQVFLWDRDKEQLKTLFNTRINKKYLPDHALPENIKIVFEFAEIVDRANDILLAVPSDAFRETLQNIKKYLAIGARLVWVTKGLDNKTHMPLIETAYEILGERDYAVIAGPSFAKEVASCMPTAVVIAHNNEVFAKDLANVFNKNFFRTYLSSDMVGVQIVGAIKNVIAIAAGISDGMGFGSNARSALITRGLAEIMRLGIAMHAHINTFLGLAGVGDLVLTCTDDQSRNRRLGLALAKGSDLQLAINSIGQTTEGEKAAHHVMHLAKKYNIEMPICEQVINILLNKIQIKSAIENLFSRAIKEEF